MEQFAPIEIGARIRQARLERGMTQEDLAALMPFSSRSLQDYEAGLTIPFKHFRELAKALGKPPMWFLYGNDDPEAVETARFSDVLTRIAAVERQLEEALSLLRDLRDRFPASPEAPPSEGT
jgi:transcriptional regulator with XRE-family HTH domain